MGARSTVTAAAFALALVTVGAAARADDAEPLPAPTRVEPTVDDLALPPARAEPPVYVFAPPPPVAGESELGRPRAPVEPTLANGGVEIALGTTMFQPSLGGTFFDGTGTPRGGNKREGYHHAGREVGLDRPLMWGGELSVSYLRRYFAVGLLGFVAGNTGGANAPPAPLNTLASTQVSPSSLLAYGGGIDLAAAVPLGLVAVRVGAVFGLRGFSMPMSGFEPKTCRSKGRNYPCAEMAWTNAEPFLQPRLRVEVNPSSRNGFFFGAMAGLDVLGGDGPTVGVFVGWQTPHDTLRP
jgi:hypothetical protein